MSTTTCQVLGLGAYRKSGDTSDGNRCSRSNHSPLMSQIGSVPAKGKALSIRFSRELGIGNDRVKGLLIEVEKQPE